MNIAVCGGDESAARLCALLREDGHRVRSFALDGADVGGGVMKVGCLEVCFDGVEVVILPQPAAVNGHLYAPMSPSETDISELVSKIPEGALICAGGTEQLPEGQYIEDYAARENFAVSYAALASEGAVELAMAGSDRALYNSHVLVLGYGRLGTILSSRLAALGARVTVAARREGDLAMAEAMGYDVVAITALDGKLGGFDYIFNTVPAQVLNTKRLAEIRCGAFMAELAGEPGGFDVLKAETLGIRAVSAAALPGKCAPQAAAQLVRDAVYAIMEEWKI